MPKLEILCVTMHQKDFSKIEEMNINSDVVFANQSDTTGYDELEFKGYTAKMITTATRGVGINRNLTLCYSSGDILLLSDDDMCYTDTYREDIIAEFEKHTNADVMIFNIATNNSFRKQKINTKTKKTNFLSRMPYGAPRIAIRRTAFEKSNVWFTLLFGGGAKFTNGEDSLFLNDLRKKGLKVWVSSVNIGNIDMSDSTWFKDFNYEFFFNKGAYLEAVHKYTFFIWMLYFAFRVKSKKISFSEKLKWLKLGRKGYRNMCDFKTTMESVEKNV